MAKAKEKEKEKPKAKAKAKSSGGGSSKIKELLTGRFEILAVAVAIVLVAVCTLWGITTFLGASSPEQAILKDVATLKSKQTNAPKLEPGKKAAQLIGWGPVTPKDAPILTFAGLFPAFGSGPGKRVSPSILTVDGAFQMDYVVKGTCIYKLSTLTEEKVTVFDSQDAADKAPVVAVKRERMVVVSGTFPYKEQCELFQKALLMDNVQALFTRGMAPTLEGLIVERRKVTIKDGKEVPGEWEPLYGYDTEKGYVLHDTALETLFRESAYDLEEVDRYRDVIHGMSVTPLPKLMSGNYPEIKLAGIADAQKKQRPKIDPKKKEQRKADPERPHFGAPRPSLVFHPTPDDLRKTRKVAFDDNDLHEQLRAQFSGKFNPFSAYGTFTEPDLLIPPIDPKDQQSQPFGKPAADAKYDGPLDKTANKIREKMPVNPKALVRFVDVSVLPGGVYQYRVRLRLANPNFGQPVKILLNGSLALLKELHSEWTLTPLINVPAASDFKCYLTTQTSNYVSRFSAPRGIDKISGSSIADKYVPFQVHKSVDAPVADWVVAERLLVARGEHVGRKCEVEVMNWNEKKMQWELVPDPKKQFGGKGAEIDFSSTPPVVLLDFTGGYQSYKLSKSTINEESGIEALMLMPDLTMVLKTTRHDMDEQLSESARARNEAYEQWKNRIDDLRNTVKGGGRLLPR